MTDEMLFAAAREQADPVAFLDATCPDSEQRDRVAQLFATHADTESFRKEPVVGDAFDDSTRPFEGPIPSHPDGRQSLSSPGPREGSIGRIGHYEVLEELGRGGFGIVFRAFDEVLQRVVAVKVLSRAMAAMSPARKRFLREARSAAAIRHENVVHVYAVEEQPIPYLVMEFVPGESLAQRIMRTGPLDPTEAARLGCQIATGLAAAHAAGVIHRDIKPANILAEGVPPRVKITDFGLARTAYDASLTRSGAVAGTPMYMAPEQVRGEVLDGRADLFSLGSVLYALLTGHSPFRAENVYAVLKRVTDDTPRPIRDLMPEVPRWLCSVIEKLHAKNPAERFQTAQEVVEVLTECEARLKARDELDALPRSTGGTPGRGTRWKWLAAGVAIAALAPILFLALSPRKAVDNPGSRPVTESGRAISSLPPTPADAVILDAAPYLPLHPLRPKKVVDFVEIHGVHPDQAAAWLKRLGPNYFPSVIGEHATANPPQFHAVAYKLDRPVPYRLDYAKSIGEDQVVVRQLVRLNLRVITASFATSDPGPEGYYIRASYADQDYFWYLDEPPERVQAGLALKQKDDYRPHLIIPMWYPNKKGVRLICLIGAYGRRNWAVDCGLLLDELKAFSEAARAKTQYVHQIRSYRGPSGAARFDVIAWENSKKYDWNFKADMTTAEYEAELVRRKAGGFRPTTVTSYGDPANPKYAAAWIRYFDPPKK